MNHSLNWCVQKHWLIQEQNKWRLYEWFIDLFIEVIYLKTLIHSETNKWLDIEK